MNWRKTMGTISMFVLLLALLPVLGLAQDSDVAVGAGKIEAELLAQMDGQGAADFIVRFMEQADLSAAYGMDWEARGEFVYETLKEVAARSQVNAKAYLDGQGLDYHTFIAGNELYVWAGDLEAATGLAALPEVGYIRATRTMYIDPIIEEAPSTPDSPDALAWGILDVHADQFWATFGMQGDGIVVANIDTGVEYTHSALDQAYKCWPDASDPACWEDPSNICGGSMCDNNGHGTHTMGTMVADDDPALTWQAGMAPNAQWIACKGCESSSCSDYALNTCADWILAPDGDPANRPHIVNNSWGGGGCDNWYVGKVQAWRAAGTYPAFSAGNSTGCSSMGSPGDYQESFASTGHNSSRAHSYAQGPSCYGHDPYTKPNISAPAVSVCSSIPGNGWTCGYSGTSMASPHSAGAVALLWSCNPSLIGQMDMTFEALQNTADAPDPANPACGVPPDNEGTYEDGYGYLNVYQAGMMWCGDLGWLDGYVLDASTSSPIEGAEVVADPAVEGAGTEAVTDPTGYYTMPLMAGTYDVTAMHPLYTAETVAGVVVISNTTTVQDFDLDPKGMLYGYVTDYDTGMPLDAMVEADDGTTAYTDPATGYYEMYLDEGTYDVTASAPDYADGTATVDILSGEDTQQDFALVAAVVFLPTPVHVTLDWQTLDTSPATIMNRMVEPYDFEFFEISGGFVPTLLGERAEPAWFAQARVTSVTEEKVAADGAGTGVWPDGAGGPDPFGYTYMDSAEPGGPAFEWIEISGTGQNLSLGDDDHIYPVPLPGTFNFYGVDYTQIAVGSNGVVYFEDTYLGLANECLPGDGGYGVWDFIAGYWDDLNPSSAGAVYYEVVNHMGQDLAVIEWYQVPHYGGSDAVTYEVILFENGSVLIQYMDPSGEAGSGATVGIQGYTADPSYYLEYSCNTSALSDMLAICYTYPGSPGCIAGGDVPWLGEVPITGTVPPSGTLDAPGTLDVTLLFTATYAAGVDQPGDYYADLLVSGDPDLTVRVTMTVLPPADMGKVEGYVLDRCTGDPVEATVSISGGVPITETMSDPATGHYAVWLVAGSYETTFSAPGYLDYDTTLDVTAGQTTTVDVDLFPDRPCIEVEPDMFEVWLVTGTAVYTHPTGMDITNNGAQALDFEISETTASLLLGNVTVEVPAFEPVDNPAAKVGPAGGQPRGALSLTIAELGPSLQTYDVLLVSPDSTGGDISLLLTTLGAYSDLNVTVWDNTQGNPTAADMAPYHVVFIGNDITWESEGLDKVAIGNAVADYIDGGGKVVESLYVESCFDQWGFAGRYMTEGYSAFTCASTDSWNPDTMNILEPTHPVMVGVTSIGDNWGHQNPGVAAGASLLAGWSTSGYNAVAVNDNVVALNQLIFHQAAWTGDVGTLLHNAITWLAGTGGGDVPWIWEDPVSGTVPADIQATANVEIMFTALYSDLTPMPLGTYSATLLVDNNDLVAGTQEVPAVMHIIEEYVTPTAMFDSNTPVCLGEEMVFTNLSDPGIPPATYTWDFGDGNTSTDENPTHVYVDAGVYTVELEACNLGGCDTYSADVEVLPAPTAGFDYTAVGLEVTFINLSMDADSYEWDFGDGMGSTVENPVHTYAAEGTYTVVLTATNSCDIDVYSADVEVTQYMYIYLPIIMRD